MESDQKILIVDDDTFLLNMYSMKFKNSGYEVTTIQSGKEALTKIQEGYAPDIILLDVIMPVLDGLELLAEIRKEKLVPNATIIMLTNQSDTVDIEKAKSYNVNGYIVKATTIPSDVITQVTAIHQEARGSGKDQKKVA
ncbi:MAG: two component transcriptional regulator, two-component system, OmpR family, response regulator [Candidatus Paceibacter sp.]|jgi:two-component system response regulator MtrA|nr:two component transcriptional regulator, two-component system, OmpR family, response regulator [Candidatus Paceibacter sp.]